MVGAGIQVLFLALNPHFATDVARNKQKSIRLYPGMIAVPVTPNPTEGHMNLLIIVATPFVISLLLAVPQIRNIIPKVIMTWSIPIVMGVLFGMLVQMFPEVQANGAVVPEPIPWIPALDVSLSFYLDGLSLLFGLVVAGIGAVIFLYTGYYFEDVKKQGRFTMWLAAFTGAMLGLVLSGNLILMFIMWELTSITSFMLIGFYGNKDEEARVSARRALVITGAGGLALLAGVLLLGGMVGQTLTTDTSAVAAFVEDQPEADAPPSTTFEAEDSLLVPFRFEYTDMLAVETVTDHPWFLAMALLIMLGAFTKSAQFPFHFWLPGAMTAPTPASAFLHSATMVKAGIYLLARLYPVMYQHIFWVNSLVTIGLITMFISALFALKQRDLKGLLAYSTTSWLGVLVVLIGLPSFNGFKALAIGILGHALYKSALFLSVGSVDHSYHSRDLDRLGGVWKDMKGTAIVVIISALSMAGVPLLLGFVAKEVLLDASVNYLNGTFIGQAGTWFVVISAALTGAAGYILIWDVFFAPRKDEGLHYHAMPWLATAGPMILAVAGTFTLPFLLDPLIIPLMETVTPKEFTLYLIPAGGFANPYFQLSLLAIAGGLLTFVARKEIASDWNFLPFNGKQAYAGIIKGLEDFADYLAGLQNGKIRYYLFYILGVVAVILVTSPVTQNLISADLQRIDMNFTLLDVLSIGLLILGGGALMASVLIKRHLIAALAIGVFGYSIAGIYIVNNAPDVALVQFLVETLATVLIIVMISRINHRQRKEVADNLWNSSQSGIMRDVLISLGIGFSVFVFVLTALVNRPDRATIAGWHLENTQPEIGIPDVVSAILTDFRGMDTFVEIIVFAMTTLGVLSLLALSRKEQGAEDLPSNPEERQYEISISTPFTRTAVYLVFPFALLIAIVHVLYGAIAPGDGFTAGVVGGLALALGYVIFGYYNMKDRIRWLRSQEFISWGLALGVVNAALPIFFGGAWMGHMQWAAFSFAGLKVATTVVFEIAIGLVVFGSVGVMLEAIGHPRDVEMLEGDETYDPDYSSDTLPNYMPPASTLPEGTD